VLALAIGVYIHRKRRAGLMQVSRSVRHQIKYVTDDMTENPNIQSLKRTQTAARVIMVIWAVIWFIGLFFLVVQANVSVLQSFAAIVVYGLGLAGHIAIPWRWEIHGGILLMAEAVIFLSRIPFIGVNQGLLIVDILIVFFALPLLISGALFLTHAILIRKINKVE